MTLKFSSPIREGVVNSNSSTLSDEFLEWSKMLTGKWEYIAEDLKTTRISYPTSIMFENEDDQAAYLLRYTEPYSFFNYISLFRRVMPTIIANDIIGVSPMVGPSALIHTLRARYSNDES